MELKEEYQDAYEQMLEVNASKDRLINILKKQVEDSKKVNGEYKSDYRYMMLMISCKENGKGGNWGIIIKDYLTGPFSDVFDKTKGFIIKDYKKLRELIKTMYPNTYEFPCRLLEDCEKELRMDMPYTIYNSYCNNEDIHREEKKILIDGIYKKWEDLEIEWKLIK